MKKSISAFFVLTIASLKIFCQVDLKEIENSLAKIDRNLYASKYEVSNGLYNAFLSAIKDNDVMYQLAMVDTSNWSSALEHNAPFVNFYHSHPAYKNYPVVNVRFEAAELFCTWLTDVYNNWENRKFKSVAFKLPDVNEFTKAAKGGNLNAVYPWKGNNLYSKKGKPKANYRLNVSEAESTITAPVDAYKPNSFGLYNMSGNVAEMLSDKKITGGSWNREKGDLLIGVTYDYDGAPEVDVGFRFFMVVENE
jgi:formylglycine-generating enzyme required for sulfatase activity